MFNFDPARYFNKTTSGLSLVAIADNSSLMHFFIIQFCTLLNSFFEEVKISKEASIMTSRAFALNDCKHIQVHFSSNTKAFR